MKTEVLVKPLITEKMTKTSERFKQYGFVVTRESSKPEIISAIETLYDVKVAGISTMVYAGKNKARWTKKGFTEGKKPSFKKAIVTLEEGQEIDFYANI